MTQNRRLRSAALGLALLPLAMAASAGTAKADDTNTIRWKTIIGIAQAANVVAGIGGGGQPWSTLGGDVSVNTSTGKLRFSVHGLVLAGGNTIGTRAGIANVKGTLVCNPGGAKPDILDSAAVPLSLDGDASFNGSIGILPASCFASDPAFLIRIAAVAPGDRWLANGAVLDHDAE
jgi:hypothetical protein